MNLTIRYRQLWLLGRWILSVLLAGANSDENRNNTTVQTSFTRDRGKMR